MNRIYKFLIVLCISLSSLAFAGGIQSVKKINISGLDDYRGYMMTAFYVSARRPIFANSAAKPWIRNIFAISEATPIEGSGAEIEIPASRFVVTGFKTFNYVVLVVHNQYFDAVGLSNIYSYQPKDGNGVKMFDPSNLPAGHYNQNGGIFKILPGYDVQSETPMIGRDYFAVDVTELQSADKGSSYNITLSPRKPVFEEE